MGNAKIKIANNANTPKITFDKMAMNDAEKVFLDINSFACYRPNFLFY